MKLFEIQPEWCRQKIDTPPIDKYILPYQKKVIEFDPSVIYQRINELNVARPFERHHSIGMALLFPPNGSFCACGCGELLTGRRRRWASDDCNNFADSVFSIIAGYRDTIAFYIGLIKGYSCIKCNKSNDCELDHIHPIKFGGGNSWLSNYEFKCKPCHREKTNTDFGFKKPKVIETSNQITIF